VKPIYQSMTARIESVARDVHDSKADNQSMKPAAKGVAIAAVVILAAALVLDYAFYDEGARFADQLATFAAKFRNSPQNEAVFDYVPKYWKWQPIRVGIGKMRWCRNPPCDAQGAATVWVSIGRSGTGYRIGAEASVPHPLEIEKPQGPLRVRLRKMNGEVQVVGLE